MDNLVEMGNRWVCVAARSVATPSIVNHVCGSSVARTAVGVVAVAVVFMLAIVVVTRIAADRARA